MKRIFIPFPSVDNYKNMLKSVHRVNKREFSHVGDNGEPVFHQPEVTKLEFEGTVKIHGTNAAVVLWGDDYVMSQSRTRFTSIEKDNHGWAAWVNACGDLYWQELLGGFMPQGEHTAVVLYGEWSGGHIQKGVGVTGMEKAFIPVALRSVVFDPEHPNVVEKAQSLWLEDDFAMLDFPEDGKRIFHVDDFGIFNLTIDLEQDPKVGFDAAMAMALGVEEQCPVSKSLNPTNENQTGEGVVFRCLNPGFESSNFWFKVKGEKHQRGSGSRSVKQSVPLNNEQKSARDEFIKIAVTNDRLLQGIESLKESAKDVTIKSTDIYIGWVCKDILKEHTAELAECTKVDLDWKKHLARDISEAARSFFIEYVNTKEE